MKTNKKGFTIVELVIVIAVIAILAAILVPVISNLIRRAHVSKDTTLVQKLNTALAMDVEHESHLTMQSALEATAAIGFDVGKINAAAIDNMILWDSVNDVFCYLEKDESGAETITYIPDSVKGTPLSAGDYRLWIISDTVSDTYSTYYTGNGTTINTSKGFDVGFNKTVTSINYTNNGAAQNVVIRTNSSSTSLRIDAASDTVKHYGEVGSLNIVAVASASYHENGTVAFAEIKTGRMVLESGSAITQIHLTKSVVAEKEVFNDITIAKAEDVTMPEFSRDPVDIPEEGKLVVALQDGTETTDDIDYVWLTAVGVYEQVTVSSSGESAGTTYAAEAGTEERKTTAQQIANNITTKVGGEDYTLKATKTGDTWTYSLEGETAEATAAVATYTVTATTETVTVKDGDDVVESTTSVDNGLSETQKEDAKTEIVQEAKIAACEEHIMFNEETGRFYLNCPNCGLEFGTEAHPYLISGAREVEALIKLRDWTGYNGYYKSYRTDAADENYEYLYAKVTQDIDCADVVYPTGYSNGYYLILDGNNHTLSNVGSAWFNNVYGITIKNLTFDNMTAAKLINYCYYSFELDNVTFSNCNVTNIIAYPIKGANEDSFYCKNVNFVNCTMESAFAYVYDAFLTMENCTFDNCSSIYGLVCYGCYHYYSGYALGISLVNVDVRNSSAYGGAYVFYGGTTDCPIRFVNCDVTNSIVKGGTTMALGGFVGNASASHVSFDYCTFDGRIESATQTVAGFIGQANNNAAYCTITNSSISASTVILNKGGASVSTFNGASGNFNYNNNNNHFYGTLQSTGTASNAHMNGFANAVFAKYSAIASSADFVIEADGTVRYTGSESFDKIVIKQTMAVDEMKSGLGGYPWEVAPTLTAENVSGASVIGTIEKINDFVQVVDEENLELVRFGSTDTTLLSGNCIDEESGVYLNDGKLVLNSTKYESGAWYVLSHTLAGDTKTTFTVSVLIGIYDGEDLICAVPMSYNFSLAD